STAVVGATRNAGTGTLQGVTNITAINGLATFTNLSHNVAGTITINFSSSGLTATNSTSVTLGAASADHLVLVQGDAQTAQAATTLPINPTVRTVDQFGNNVSNVTVN